MSKPSRKRRNPLRQMVQPDESLTPHSEAWFSALRQMNRKQALVTEALLDCTRDLDPCSICGDTPASIYTLVEESHLPVRLCSDCADIQRHMGTRIQLRVRTS